MRLKLIRPQQRSSNCNAVGSGLAAQMRLKPINRTLDIEERIGVGSGLAAQMRLKPCIISDSYISLPCRERLGSSDEIETSLPQAQALKSYWSGAAWQLR